MTTKFVFVTGGVISSVGKGVTTASLGRALKNRGVKVSIIKIDPYFNIDAGTMNPFEHGEVYVTQDGGEIDQDLGHYERFIDEELYKDNNITSGKIYYSVITKERQGDYLGQDVEVLPHVVDEIVRMIRKTATQNKADVCIIELGSTIGDIKGGIYLEAFSQIQRELGRENVAFMHVTWLVHLSTTGELKTRPTQYNIRELRGMGIDPDILVCRADFPIAPGILKKFSSVNGCHFFEGNVIPMATTHNIYDVPLKLEKYGVADYLMKKFRLKNSVKTATLSRQWEEMVTKMTKINASKEVLKIAMVVKYFFKEAYISVIEATKAAGYASDKKIEFVWIDSEKLEKNDQESWELLRSVHGIIVPGGFGQRGIEGKIMTARYARENKIPYLGLCLGSQIMAIEFARQILKDPKANSEEFNPRAKNKIVHYVAGQRYLKQKGGTMRLGNWRCRIVKGTKAYTAYKQEEIIERHRHRYEFNTKYAKLLEKNGFMRSGISPETNLTEIVEIKNHPFMVGCQFHPEFKSRPNKPHPLFLEFIKTVKKLTTERKNK